MDKKFLEKEIESYFHGAWHGTESAEQRDIEMSFTPAEIFKIAEHFYKLGRNYQPNDYEDFKDLVLKKVEECPRAWRKGQAVFNVVDEQFNVAREVQFVDGVDCYYDDTKIDEFLQHAWVAYQPQLKQKFYVMKNGHCVSDYSNKEDALKHAREIDGQIGYGV